MAPSWRRPRPAYLPTGPQRTRAVLQMLGDHFTSPVFTAALELWVAARTDAALLAEVAPLELRVGRETHRMTVELLGADESRPGVRELVQATLDLVRGLGLANTITDDRRRRTRILDQWARTLDDALERPMTDLLDGAARRPRRRGRPARRPVDRLGPTRLAPADPGARVGRRHPGRPPALDRRGRRRSPRTRTSAEAKQAWDDLVARGDRRPVRLRRPRGAFELARWPRDERPRPLARRPGPGCAETLRTELPAGQKMPWFGPPMSPTSMATARFMETWAHALDVYDAARRSNPRSPTGSRHVAHLGVRTRNFAFSVHGGQPPAEEFRSS